MIQGKLPSTLGLTGYFRRSITNFRQKAKVLFEPLKGYRNRKKPREIIDWQDKNQDALDDLLQELTTPLLLAFTNFDLPFILYTDASSSGLGFALYQVQEGKLRIVGFGSRTLVRAESKHHSSKLEFLALK